MTKSSFARFEIAFCRFIIDVKFPGFELGGQLNPVTTIFFLTSQTTFNQWFNVEEMFSD